MQALRAPSPSSLEYLDVIVAQRADRVVRSLQRLLERVTELLSIELDGGIEQLEEAGVVARWQHLRYPRCWALDEGGFAELLLWPHDRWIAQPRNQPAFAAGFTFVAVEDPPALHCSRAAWRDELAQHGVHVGLEDGALRCSRVLYLAEVVARHRERDQQARAVASWAEDAIHSIAALTPPPDH